MSRRRSLAWEVTAERLRLGVRGRRVPRIWIRRVRVGLKTEKGGTEVRWRQGRISFWFETGGLEVKDQREGPVQRLEEELRRVTPLHWAGTKA